MSVEERERESKASSVALYAVCVMCNVQSKWGSNASSQIKIKSNMVGA